MTTTYSGLSAGLRRCRPMLVRLGLTLGLALGLALGSGSLTNLRPAQAIGVEQAVAAPTASRIEGMPVYAQQRTLSCEYAAARAAVARWGVRLNEVDFIVGIGYNENPHLGFRGNIDGGWGGTSNYGVYPEPIARFLATKGFNTKLIWAGVAQLKQEVAQGRPVVVWVAGSMNYGAPFEAEAEGVPFLLMPYEHTVTVYGYDEGGVYVANPGYGTYEYYNWTDFTRSWSYLGNMAMSIWPAEVTAGGALTPQLQPGERPGIAPQFYRYWLRQLGLELTGLPIAPAYLSDGKLSQYFERTRLEYDINGPLTQPVGRGLLGREVTAGQAAAAPFQPLNEVEIATLTAEEQARYFDVTGFMIATDFSRFWPDQGGLAVFGYPISRPFFEDGRWVQYFERARMELHLEGPEQNQVKVVRLGLLGHERLTGLIGVSQQYSSE